MILYFKIINNIKIQKEIIILMIILLLINYLLDFMEFKTFCKKNFYVDINFFKFTYNLIKKKLERY